MKLLLLLSLLNWYTVTIQTKGGVRFKTTVQAASQYQAKQMVKEIYKEKIIISVVQNK